MKKFLFILILVFSVLSSKSQKVYSVDYSSQADVKVFVVDYMYQADLKVFKVAHEYQTKGNIGLWFFTDNS